MMVIFLKRSLIATLLFTSVKASAVINGVTTNEYDSVVAIRSYKSGTDLCTGTVISHNKVLTAQHCIDACDKGKQEFETENQSDQVYIHVGNSQLSSRKVFCMPKFLQTFLNPKYDVAIVEFNHKIDLPIARLTSNPIEHGEKVFIVGFGANSYRFREVDGSLIIATKGDGVKRLGINSIAKIENGLIFVFGRLTNRNLLGIENLGSISYVDGSRALPLVGDSGGPLLNESGEIVGITTNGVFRYNPFGLKFGVGQGRFVNILNPEIASFIHDIRFR